MKREVVGGIGTVRGGKFDVLEIGGIGKLKGTVTANKVIAGGLFKSKGEINADTVEIGGVARIFKDIKAKKVKMGGVVKIRRADVNADEIICDGILVSNGEICADEIRFEGVFSVSKMYGDNIVLKYNHQRLYNRGNSNNLAFPKQNGKYKPLIKMYLGRDIGTDCSIVDVIECTNLEAEGIRAKVISANNIKLKNNCIVDKVFCDGKLEIDDTCIIKEINSETQPIIARKEIGNMANATLVKILDLYKEGKINADEAEKMIKSVKPDLGTDGFWSDSNNNSSIGNKIYNGSLIEELPWEDDGKLRIVAYIGRRLLKKGDPGATSIEVKYDGEALNVECHGNLYCGEIKGNVATQGSIYCKKIYGKVAAGGGITLEE